MNIFNTRHGFSHTALCSLSLSIVLQMPSTVYAPGGKVAELVPTAQQTEEMHWGAATTQDLATEVQLSMKSWKSFGLHFGDAHVTRTLRLAQLIQARAAFRTEPVWQAYHAQWNTLRAEIIAKDARGHGLPVFGET